MSSQRVEAMLPHLRATLMLSAAILILLNAGTQVLGLYAKKKS
jgi:hypothetical protein